MSATRALERAPQGVRRARSRNGGRALRTLVSRSLLDRRRSIIAWGISAGLLCAFTAAVYPSMQDSIGKAVEGYPEGIKEAFGVGQLATVEEYLSVEAFNLFVPLALAFFAIRSIVRSLPAAEESGSLDTLLSAPVPPRLVAAAAFATTALALLFVLAIIGAFTWAAAQLSGADLGVGPLVAGVANVWPLTLLFAALALVANGLRPGAGMVTGVASGALVAMYVIDLLGKLADPIEPLRYASVFRYYGTAIEDGIDPIAFAGITLTATALAWLGAFLFDRRDVLG